MASSRPPRSPFGRGGRRRHASGPPPAFAALDLGTNNCRLLVAAPDRTGFRVLSSFSRIVRLGEGMGSQNRLSDAAQDRALEALRICSEILGRKTLTNGRYIATQACRATENGEAFIDRVKQQTGIALEIITPAEEARLAVMGCLNLIDPSVDAVLIVDVGGGSTELAWVDVRALPENFAEKPGHIKNLVGAWTSLPIGVVSLSERYPEPPSHREVWFRAMVDTVIKALEADPVAEAFRPAFDAGRVHIVGSSGAITSLAGVHLDLPRYDRARVDGLWMNADECRTVTTTLYESSLSERMQIPCIGEDRADLVVAGAAILQAVTEVWPSQRLRVADRGLREGMLWEMIGTHNAKRAKRRRKQKSKPAGGKS